MAFDTETRNKLRSTVEQCRKLLCGTYDKLGGEVTAQLQEYYGIQPTGDIANLEDLELSERERETAVILRELIAHYAATDSGKGTPKQVTARAVQRLVVEQAFTIVNRLAALRMAEADERKIIQPCVSKAYDSDGFQLYEQTAGSDMGDRFERYRCYLFCLFDELTLDLAPLFDRFSSTGLIFPRERVLLALLDLLNDGEITHLWDGDEPIGWIYQYWNSDEERKALKKASATPRNTRELAVLNQFFTPRYVVQFLTDNTLGRTWYEMCRGETRLKEQCEYLVRRNYEFFMLDADEYVTEECANWVSKVRNGDFAAAELSANWEEISAVALAIDGYDVAEKMGYGEVHDYVSRRIDRAIEQGRVDDSTLLDQWLLLFSIQRRFIREGQVFDNNDYARAAKKAWEAWVIAAKAEASDPVSESELDGLTMDLEGGLEEAHQRIYGEPLDPEIPIESWIEAAWQGDLSQLVEEYSVNNRLVAVAVPQKAFKKVLDDPDFDSDEDERLVETMRSIDEGRPNEDAKQLSIVWAALSDFAWRDGSRSYGADTWDRLWAHFCLLARINTAALKMQELSQEELLNKPVLVPPRPFKDPREIRLLDPACGSMHFGLYAFDLYETIYEEAWYRGLLPEGDFESFEDFQRQVPRLIIEHNIHGVDIDPRAAQIAGLSLWLRAQRSWKDRSIDLPDRPRVEKSNIVCAEPMPGDEGQLKAFCQDLNPVLAHVITAIFEKMQLAGEAGSLLKIEEDISTIVREAKEAWEAIGKQTGEFFSDAEIASGDKREKKQKEFEFGGFSLETLSSVSEADFFEKAEDEIYGLLARYAENAGAQGYKRKLFAKDAAQGFALIDLCRKRYDAVVMNPPFGSFTRSWASEAKRRYPRSYNDILGAFVDRFIDRLHPSGFLGAITSRTCFFLSSFSAWRREVVLGQTSILGIADLGQGVMDEAMVEAAAYVVEKTRPISHIPVFRAISKREREPVVTRCVRALNTASDDCDLFLANQRDFAVLSDAPFVYWLSGRLIRQFQTGDKFEGDVGKVRQGLSTADDPRFVRTTWEVPFKNSLFCYYPVDGTDNCLLDSEESRMADSLNSKGQPIWAFHVKSGASQPWYSPITVKVNYENEGRELLGFRTKAGKLRGAIRSPDMYYRPGFSWTRRAVRLFPYVVPAGCIPSASRYMAFPDSGREAEAVAICASRLVSSFLRFYGEFWQRPNFLVEMLKMIPWPSVSDSTLGKFQELVEREVKARREAYQNHEPFHDFLLPAKICDFSNQGKALDFSPLNILDEELEAEIATAYGFDPSDVPVVERDLRESIEFQKRGSNDEADEDDDFVLSYSPQAIEEANISYLVGCAFGHWDIRYATKEKEFPILGNPFNPLPASPPGLLQGEDGLPLAVAEFDKPYPIAILSNGIVANEASTGNTIVNAVKEGLDAVWKDQSDEVEANACKILGKKSLAAYFAENKGGGQFFKDHLARYTKSRRKAPIYWPLSTKSGSYTLWVYYHRLSDQTLYICCRHFVEPKLDEVTEEFQKLDGLQERNSSQQKKWERLEKEIRELSWLRDELLRVAQLPWKPNLNDGVQITAAPLHELFRNTAWRNTLKKTWESLETGDLDWSHLAYPIWKGRVIKACQIDRSIAIAHNVDDLFWEEDDKGKWKPRKPDEEEVENAMKEGRLLINPLEKLEG